ncbi:hypothetical protein AtEden1_Chr2g0234701 [Arabidopsis thaliana]
MPEKILNTSYLPSIFIIIYMGYISLMHISPFMCFIAINRPSCLKLTFPTIISQPAVRVI